MATRLLLRLLIQRTPPPAGSSSVRNLLHRSPPNVGHLHAPPRALLPNVRWFGGGSQNSSSSFKAAPPHRSIVQKMLLCASFVSTSAAALLDLEDMKSPPTRPHPASTSDAAAILLYWNDGDEDNPPTRPHVEREKRRMTDVLIALNLLVHAVDVVTNRKLIVWGYKDNDLIRKGQLWRLATASLLHTGMIHITLNMLCLDDIGSTMEEINGPGRLLAIYCASAIAGSLMSYRFNPGKAVGASGAICGLFGAQAVYTWRRRESLTSSTDTFEELAWMTLFSLAVSVTLKRYKIRIDDWAHLGGLLGGAAVQWFLGPHEKHVVRVGMAAFEDRRRYCSTNEQYKTEIRSCTMKFQMYRIINLQACMHRKLKN